MALAGCLAACSSGSGSEPRAATYPVATKSPGAGPSFIAFEPGRHERLLVVDAATGRVQETATGPGSAGYAASLTTGLAYLPIDRANCRLTVLRVPLTSATSRHTNRRVAAIHGGPIDDVQAQPALSVDGNELAVLVASRPSVDSGMGPTCGDTDQVAIVSLTRGTVRYVTSRAGDQLDDLAWDGSRLLVRITSPSRPVSSHVVEIGGETKSLSGGRMVIAERGGRPGPVFRWHGGLAVLDSGALHRVSDGHVVSKPLPGTGGQPTSVDRVSVAPNGVDLLLQTSAGAVYWWNGHSTRDVPVTVAGHWDEPI